MHPLFLIALSATAFSESAPLDMAWQRLHFLPAIWAMAPWSYRLELLRGQMPGHLPGQIRLYIPAIRDCVDIGVDVICRTLAWQYAFWHYAYIRAMGNTIPCRRR